MSIVLGIGDPLTLAEWERQMRSPYSVPARSGPLTVSRLTHIPYAGDPPPPDIGTGHYQPPPVPQGWQCPVCRTVYAPSVTQCWCAKVAQLGGVQEAAE